LPPFVQTASPLLTSNQRPALRLRVSENQRFLVRDDGSPFSWFADTAWEMFHRLTREEAADYLEKRSEQGFTLIQSVVLAEFEGVRQPNAYGDHALIEEDPARPNEPYFRHVDWIVEKANSLGLVVGMLPTWGDKVGETHGDGPRIFTAKNARAYGEILGRRYRQTDLVWIIGGDRLVDDNQKSQVTLSSVPDVVPGAGVRRIQATREANGRYAMVYSASSRKYAVSTHALSGRKLHFWWFDPRNGGHVDLGSFDKPRSVEVSPPSLGEDIDFVFVMDDAEQCFPPPGSGQPGGLENIGDVRLLSG
jgi:hypothetical protein